MFFKRGVRLKYILLCVFLSLQTITNAKNIAVTLSLKTIVLNKAQESDGDELYFDILTYSNLNASKQLRVPTKPNYWLSEMLQKLKNVTLWHGHIQDNEKRTLQIALMEFDSPPWALNDEIGQISITLHNQNNQLSYALGGALDMTKDFKPITRPLRPIVFDGDNANYVVTFVLKKD